MVFKNQSASSFWVGLRSIAEACLVDKKLGGSYRSKNDLPISLFSWEPPQPDAIKRNFDRAWSTGLGVRYSGSPWPFSRCWGRSLRSLFTDPSRALRCRLGN